MTPTDTMQRYFAAWSGHDFSSLEALFDAEVTFRGPLGAADGPADLRRGLEGMSTLMEGLEIRAMAAYGPDVLTWFDMLTAKAGALPVANWSRVHDGRIRQVRATFDPRPLL